MYVPLLRHGNTTDGGIVLFNHCSLNLIQNELSVLILRDKMKEDVKKKDIRKGDGTVEDAYSSAGLQYPLLYDNSRTV